MNRLVQRHATSEKVLRTTSRLFREQGFADTTIRDIAAASGVSVGTVMSVGNKESLLVSSFDQLIGSIHSERAQHDSIEAGNCAEQVIALLDPFVDVFAAHPVLARTYGSILISGTHDSVVFSDLAETLVREIEATLLRSSRAAAGRVPTLAQGIYFAYIGCLFAWPATYGDDVGDLNTTLRRVVNALCPDEETSL